MRFIITFGILSIILTETARTPPSPLLFQNGETVQFGIYAFQLEIFTKYALVKSLCIHCIIMFGKSLISLNRMQVLGL